MPSTHSPLCFGVWNSCSWTLICSSWRDAKASTLTSDTSGVSLQPWATTWECDVQSKLCRLSVSCLLWFLVFATVLRSVSSLTAWICMVISPKTHNMKQHVTTSHNHLRTSQGLTYQFPFEASPILVFVECLTFELPHEACDAVDMQVPTPLDSGSQKRSQLARPQLLHCDTVACKTTSSFSFGVEGGL